MESELQRLNTFLLLPLASTPVFSLTLNNSITFKHFSFSLWLLLSSSFYLWRKRRKQNKNSFLRWCLATAHTDTHMYAFLPSVSADNK